MALTKLDAKLLMSKLVPADFDWNKVHAVHGTPLMALAHETIRLCENNRAEAPCWSLVRHALAQGADPRKPASKASGSSCGWSGDSFPLVNKVVHANHSAITLTYAILALIESHKEYKAQVTNARKLVEVFADFEPEQQTPKILVPEASVDLWEAFWLSDRFKDIELHVTDPASGSAQPVVIRAHSPYLRTASRVLDAILSTPMTESKSGVIAVRDVSVASVKLCLQLIYTGLFSDEENQASVLLGAVDIAHRWQVGHVVDSLEQALIRAISDSTIEAIFEAAFLKGLTKLTAACKSYAASSNKARDILKKCLANLQQVPSTSSGEPGQRKKKRVAL